MIKNFNLENDIVKSAEIGVKSESGFSGIKIEVHSNKYFYIYYLHDIKIYTTKPDKLMDAMIYSLIRGYFNKVQYNLLVDCQKILTKNCSFEEGVIYHDSDYETETPLVPTYPNIQGAIYA